MLAAPTWLKQPSQRGGSAGSDDPLLAIGNKARVRRGQVVSSSASTRTRLAHAHIGLVSTLHLLHSAVCSRMRSIEFSVGSTAEVFGGNRLDHDPHSGGTRGLRHLKLPNRKRRNRTEPLGKGALNLWDDLNIVQINAQVHDLLEVGPSGRQVPLEQSKGVLAIHTHLQIGEDQAGPP
jgi:hypothetical protein